MRSSKSLRRPTAAELPAWLRELQDMAIDVLRREWTCRVGGKLPAIQSRDVLRRLIAWKVQEGLFGGHDAETERRLKALLADHKAARPLGEAGRRLTPGTMLTREWKGRMHQVTVEAKRFTYDGKTYRSLSEIARVITGTRWSGPRLFGVEMERGMGRVKA